VRNYYDKLNNVDITNGEAGNNQKNYSFFMTSKLHNACHSADFYKEQINVVD